MLPIVTDNDQTVSVSSQLNDKVAQLKHGAMWASPTIATNGYGDDQTVSNSQSSQFNDQVARLNGAMWASPTIDINGYFNSTPC